MRSSDIRIRAIEYITRSDNPLQKLVDFVTETPLVASKLDEVDAATAAELASKLDKEDLQPSFMINGHEIDLKTLDIAHILEDMRAQRKTLSGILNDHLGLNAGIVRDLATHDASAEDDDVEPELIDLAQAVEGLPRTLTGLSFLEGGE